MIVVRQKYPRWWFDCNRELPRFANRGQRLPAIGGGPLPVDRSTAVRAPAVRVSDVPRDLNRWLPLVKWFLAIPHDVLRIDRYQAFVMETAGSIATVSLPTDQRGTSGVEGSRVRLGGLTILNAAADARPATWMSSGGSERSLS